MSYETIDLPAGGFQDGDGSGPVLYRLEVAVGAREEFSTELHVRGMVLTTRYFGGGYFNFAGSTVLREGRDAIDHDIRVFGPASGRHAGLEEEIAVAVHLALDAHGERVMAAEMARICGE